ncbi:MAG: ribonuclease HII [Pseudomonadota bacterium]
MGSFVRQRLNGPDATYEQQARQLGFSRVAGVDEAGRGPLAGPVVAAAVVLPLSLTNDGPFIAPTELEGLNDSKQVTEAKREHLFETLCAVAEVSIASVSVAFIDARNIRKASLEAMRLALIGLPTPPSFALIDGKDEPPGMPCAGRALVKGDARSLSIAAASICAKVTRDRMMVAADRSYPGYGFAEHKGYATPVHRASLQELGPSPIHRRTFAPVREALVRHSS